MKKNGVYNISTYVPVQMNSLCMKFEIKIYTIYVEMAKYIKAL